MPWDIIITGIISLVSGGGIMQLINWKASKRKANLENDATAIDTLKDVISEIRVQNDNFQQINQQRENEIEQLQAKVLEKENDITLCQSLLCKKMCCKNRLPISGLGPKFFNDLKEGKEELDYNEL